MKTRVFWLTILGGVILSAPAWQGSGRDISFWENFFNFAGRFFPPDFSDIEQILEALLETVQIAFLATLIAAFISLALGIIGAPWMSKPFRLMVTSLLACVRSIPSLLLAVLAVALIGPNPRAGVLALSAYSIGYLGKFILDDASTLDTSLLQTYQRWGLHPVAAFRFGFWPQLRRHFLAHCLWMFEYNIRSASIIGYVGAGGLGLLLHSYQEYGHWNKFATVLFAILIIVLGFEIVSRYQVHRKTGQK